MKEQTATKKRRMGRPPVQDELVRRNRVVTMVTDAELEILQEVASAEEQSISTLVHGIVGRFLARKRK